LSVTSATFFVLSSVVDRAEMRDFAGVHRVALEGGVERRAA